MEVSAKIQFKSGLFLTLTKVMLALKPFFIFILVNKGFCNICNLVKATKEETSKFVTAEITRVSSVRYTKPLILKFAKLEKPEIYIVSKLVFAVKSTIVTAA